MIRNSNSLDRYVVDIQAFDLISPADEIKLAKRIKKGDKVARETMINANLRLVVKIANDYADLGVPVEDLVNEGNMGLMKAVDRFDPKFGAKLSTYAAWWIKQAIKRALANQGRDIRLPVHINEKLFKMRRLSRETLAEFGRDATLDELAEEVGLTTETVQTLMTASALPVSMQLEIDVKDHFSQNFGDKIKDERAEDPTDAFDLKLRKDQVASILNCLTGRERLVIEHRFGFSDGEPQTLESISSKLDVTRERVRQIQNIALGKLQRFYRKTYLDVADKNAA